MLRTDVPEVFSSVISLGEPKKVFKPSAGAIITNILLCLILGALGIFFISTSLEYRSAESGNSYLINLIVGLLFLIFVLYYIWKLIAKWGEMVVVYEKGFGYSDGDEAFSIPWGDVTSFTMRVIQMRYYGFIPAGTVRAYKIETRSGKKIKLDSTLSRIEELINLIREKITPLQLEQYIQALEKGMVLQFGPVTVSRDLGIQERGNICRWAEIDNIVVANGEIYIKPNKKNTFRGAHFPVHEVPNVDAFLIITSNLLNQYIKQAATYAGTPSQKPFIGE
jgi:hypothetical protein